MAGMKCPGIAMPRRCKHSSTPEAAWPSRPDGTPGAPRQQRRSTQAPASAAPRFQRRSTQAARAMPPPQKVPPVGRGGPLHKEPPPKSAGKRGKRICGGEEEFCLLLRLLLGHGDGQFLQLLVVHKVGTAGHGRPLALWPRGTPFGIAPPRRNSLPPGQGFA